MNDAQLAEIAARAEAATPGPWETWGTKVLCGVEERHGEYSRMFADGGHEIADLDAMEYANAYSESMDDDTAELQSEVDAEADAAFIAAARTDVPALLAEVTRLRAEQCTNPLRSEIPCDSLVRENDRLRGIVAAVEALPEKWLSNTNRYGLRCAEELSAALNPI